MANTRITVRRVRTMIGNRPGTEWLVIDVDGNPLPITVWANRDGTKRLAELLATAWTDAVTKRPTSVAPLTKAAQVQMGSASQE